MPHPMNRFCLLFILLCLAPALPAQNRYDGQITAIEQMIGQGKFRLARAQSTALAEEGRQQQLSNIEAYGHYLHGRALLEDPASSSQQRVEGVQYLRMASRGFTDGGMVATVDSIAARLKDIRGGDTITIRELPEVRDMRLANRLSERITEEELDQSALSAIVVLQNREIEALNDSQLRQLVLLQKKDMEIDSFQFQTLNDSMLLMRQQMLLDEQRSLTREEVQRRNFLIVLAGGVLVALGLLYLRYRSVRRYQSLLSEKNIRIQEEQQRSNDLLLNILPYTVARELKATGKATARRYESATVMFSDFVGFSKIASNREPEELVRLLDQTFRAFDEIIERHGLEKIKTIGDAYMCVGGVPVEEDDHAGNTVRAALEIQRYLEKDSIFRARIGIHSGPVVAGVVGRNKFAFDIWGDTVNQAARLEKAGTPGEVTISATTCDLLGAAFDCRHVGIFEAKNIGEMDRYVVRESRLTKNPS
ncbi:adenylate/guanylate cyclase domain-containing protein [Lewinella sp. JB7]|uniref:adenylate/guanylate cyclase domain-containing protein n=1 Tax=Lewinella sp. JB7 TaxID=2962887 RepID=UPI0020C9D5B3|nr:adenylate/guanylate cyclase domain-containing protein [Lewinella sp. JB7]MCP9235732.1 adenylate/guanylate cyclase domain-containing protein [Lewinella sp. JB7]